MNDFIHFDTDMFEAEKDKDKDKDSKKDKKKEEKEHKEIPTIQTEDTSG